MTDTASSTPDPPAVRGRVRRGTLIDVAMVAVAVAVLVSGVLAWDRAAGHDDEQVARAELRDEVLIAATQHIETMNTLDYQDVAADLKRWEDVTTGTLHDQLVQVADEERELLADQKKISKGAVVDAAVLDLTADTATVLAAVEVTVKDGVDPEAQPVVKRHRFSAELVEVDGAWLLESLEQVSVSLS